MIISKIYNIQNELSALDGALAQGNTADEIKRLDTLVHKKIAFSYQILNAYKSAGKEAGERLISDQGVRLCRDCRFESCLGFVRLVLASINEPEIIVRIDQIRLRGDGFRRNLRITDGSGDRCGRRWRSARC